MASLIQTHSSDWDPSQFKLQSDGTFRISIRGMAAMAGIDDGALSRSLRSAAAENVLPCARSLVAQGFDPAAVSTWGETGGIPEDAAPFILEHYGINATNPSAQARAVLLAFSRVGINAYLKERLGVSQVRDTQPACPALAAQKTLDVIERSYGLLERLGVVDERDRLQFGDMVRNVTARAAGGGLLMPANPEDEELTLSEAWLRITGEPLPKNRQGALGRVVAAQWRTEFKTEPPTRRQFVDGAPREVKSYRRGWLERTVQAIVQTIAGPS